MADGAPGSVGQVHADQHVSGNAYAVDDLALRVLDLDDFFHRNLDLEDVIFHVQGLDAGLEVGLHAVLVACVGVDDVPVTFLAAQLGLEFLGRISRGGGSGRFQGDALFRIVFFVYLGSGLVVHVSVFGFVDVGSFGRSGINLGLVCGYGRILCGPVRFSLVYLELLLRHLVSCFLIA